MSKEKWYQAGLAFECTQCGHCCSGPPGYVWVTRRDIRAIAEFLGYADGRLPHVYVRRVGFRHSLTERNSHDCIFLQRNGAQASCAIYPVRPLQCRTWPFWNSNVASLDAWNCAHRTCPGINHGRHHDFVAIEEIRLRKPE